MRNDNNLEERYENYSSTNDGGVRLNADPRFESDSEEEERPNV